MKEYQNGVKVNPSKHYTNKGSSKPGMFILGGEIDSVQRTISSDQKVGVFVTLGTINPSKATFTTRFCVFDKKSVMRLLDQAIPSFSCNTMVKLVFDSMLFSSLIPDSWNRS
jgi:hypothetical protein